MAFSDPVPGKCLRLRRLADAEWQQLLRWLDISGLSLYLLDRLTELRLTRIMPAEVAARLRQNLADNTCRMRSLLAETLALHREFENAGLSYALLKGFSLWPDCVPRPELRSQLDLDFLVAERDIPRASSIVKERGYRLRAVSNRTWEFKTDSLPSNSLKDLYKNVPHRGIELHAGPDSVTTSALLAAAETRSLDGTPVPVLASTDLFLGQALHLFKHVSSEFFRVAHLVEFRRNVVSKTSDAAFWNRIRAKAEADRRIGLALGVVTHVIAGSVDEFAPQALTEWTVQRLPVAVRLWLDHYGPQLVFRDFPGSKLYLLLQHELDAAGYPPPRPIRHALIPLRLPPTIAPATAGESPGTRLTRYRMQLRFLAFRLRFHLVGSMAYLCERIRWKRLRSRALQAGHLHPDPAPGIGRIGRPGPPAVSRTTIE